MRDHGTELPLTLMCQTLRVHRSGYYAWLQQPRSKRSIEDDR